MISNDEYGKLLDQQFETNNIITANKIISGTILKINDQHITVDIGYKSEGQIPKEEFLSTGSSDEPVLRNSSLGIWPSLLYPISTVIC